MKPIRPRAVTVEPQENFMLKFGFNNVETRMFDAKPYIKGTWYGKLRDPAYFIAVSQNGFTIEWPEGQDLCPDDIYYNSVPCHPIRVS